jgi:hypothetical protein
MFVLPDDGLFVCFVPFGFTTGYVLDSLIVCYSYGCIFVNIVSLTEQGYFILTDL